MQFGRAVFLRISSRVDRLEGTKFARRTSEFLSGSIGVAGRGMLYRLPSVQLIVFLIRGTVFGGKGCAKVENNCGRFVQMGFVLSAVWKTDNSCAGATTT